MNSARALLPLLAAISLIAQENPAQPPPGGGPLSPTIRVSVNTVIAPTTVLDRHGNYVANLKPHEFTLYDNGKAQNIQVDYAFVPISLVIAIQKSANMESMLPKIQRTAAMFQPLVVGEQGEIAVIAFDHRVQTVQDFTSDADKVAAAFKAIKIGSTQSALNDATQAATRMLRHRPEGRRRIVIVFSESRDTGSSVRAREVLTDLQLANVLLYSVDISHLLAAFTSHPQPPRPSATPPSAMPPQFGGPQTPDAVNYQGTMGNVLPAFLEIFKGVTGIFIDNPSELYSRYTGGKELSFKSEKGLQEAISKIGDEVHAQYLLTYSPNNKLEGGFHEIRVTIDRSELRLRTRPGYWMAARPD
ncbi:MAG: VWA domain-containing protein [Acidobacteria bacterium]|nr:VWA domain-containing protein [Acidobacteriota bacterium]